MMNVYSAGTVLTTDDMERVDNDIDEGTFHGFSEGVSIYVLLFLLFLCR